MRLFCVAMAYRSVQEILLERSYALIMRVKSSIVVYWMCLTPDNRSYVVRVSSYGTFYRREKRAKRFQAKKNLEEKIPRYNTASSQSSETSRSLASDRRSSTRGGECPPTRTSGKLHWNCTYAVHSLRNAIVTQVNMICPND